MLVNLLVLINGTAKKETPVYLLNQAIAEDRAFALALTLAVVARDDVDAVDLRNTAEQLAQQLDPAALKRAQNLADRRILEWAAEFGGAEQANRDHTDPPTGPHAT